MHINLMIRHVCWDPRDTCPWLPPRITCSFSSSLPSISTGAKNLMGSLSPGKMRSGGFLFTINLQAFGAITKPFKSYLNFLHNRLGYWDTAQLYFIAHPYPSGWTTTTVKVTRQDFCMVFLQVKVFIIKIFLHDFLNLIWSNTEKIRKWSFIKWGTLINSK